jgi:hypothetical protein
VRAIFGTDLESIRGKTVRQTPALVVADYVEVPQLLVQINKVVTLVVDVFFWMGLLFSSQYFGALSLSRWSTYK